MLTTTTAATTTTTTTATTKSRQTHASRFRKENIQCILSVNDLEL